MLLYFFVFDYQIGSIGSLGGSTAGSTTGSTAENIIVGLREGTYDYFEEVRGITSASITATVSSGMTIKINGNLVSSGSESAMIPLIEGRNTVNLEVLSPECGDTTSYVLVIDRLPLLTNMWINGEVFDLDVERGDYQINVLDNVDHLTVTAIANLGVTVDLQSNLSPGMNSSSTWEITLREGASPFDIWLMSADNQVMNRYSFTVNRLPGLDSLYITPGALTPSFDGNNLSYTVQVNRETETISLLPVALDPLNLITINGHEIFIGITPEAIQLQRGRNHIAVKVSNPSGEVENTYHIYVYRPYPSSGSGGYSALTNNGSQLSVAFNQATGNAQVSIDAAENQEVFINVPVIRGATSYTLEVPVSVLSDSNSGNRVTLTTEIGWLTLPADMLNGQIGAGNAEITIGAGDVTTLPEEIRTAIGTRPLIQLRLTLDGQAISWSNPEAPVIISIPYTPSPEELLKPEHIVIWYIDGQGNAVSVPTGRYDAETGRVTFQTTHFSNFAITYVEKTFEDLSGVEWARNAIEAMASKGIIKGTSQNIYLPKANINRGDFLILLTKTLGLSAHITENFSDVLPGQYYYEAENDEYQESDLPGKSVLMQVLLELRPQCFYIGFTKVSVPTFQRRTC